MFICHGGEQMVQKIVDIVGISSEGFDAAARNAVEICARTVRGIRWAKMVETECKVHDDKIVEYRALMRIYFDVDTED
jgi:flavin-binding protein dodecin